MVRLPQTDHKHLWKFLAFFIEYDSLILKTDFVSLWRGWKLPFSGTFCHLLLANSGILWWCYTHLLMLHTSSERLFWVKFLFWCQNLSQVIWVVFPRTGKMSKICHNFFFFGALLWPNGFIFSSFLNCSEEFMSVRVEKYFRFGPSNFFYFQKNYFFDPKSKFSAIFLTNKNAYISMYLNSMT